MSTLLEKLIGSAALKDNPLKCLCIKLKPGSVTTDKIADKAVTPAKLSDSVKTDLIQAPINAVQENLGNHVSDTTKHITAQERNTWNSKQDALTFDNLPTQGSNNPVKSNGIYNRMHILTTAIQQVSEDVVTLQQAMPGKQNVLTFDNTPTANSDNPVKSGGIKSAIDEHTENSAIHVTGLDKTKWNGYESTLTGMATQINTRTLKTSDVKVYAASDLSYTTQIGEIKSNAGKLNVESENTINITTSGEDTDINLTASDGDVKLQSGKDINIQGYEATNITGSNDLNMSAGYVTMTATEGTTAIASADNVTISAGSSSVNKEINLNANAVKVNGTNIDTIKNNAQNALNKINAMYPDQFDGMQIETPGIYYAYPDFGNPNLIPSSMSHSTFTGYLLLVTTVEEVDIHGGYRHLHQLIIDIVTGRKATRMINYPYDSTIDWSAAPNFTEV